MFRPLFLATLTYGLAGLSLASDFEQGLEAIENIAKAHEFLEQLGTWILNPKFDAPLLTNSLKQLTKFGEIQKFVSSNSIFVGPKKTIYFNTKNPLLI